MLSIGTLDVCWLIKGPLLLGLMTSRPRTRNFIFDPLRANRYLPWQE